MLSKLKQFLVYKYFHSTIISAWIVLFVFFTFFGTFGENPGSLIIVMFLVYLAIRFGKRVIKPNDSTDMGRKILHSRLGYIFLGVFFAFFVTAFLFNVIYEYEAGGFMDSRDFGFQIFSLPLSSLLHFEVNKDEIISRLVLYFITLINLGLLTLILDFFGFIITKIILLIKKLIK